MYGGFAQLNEMIGGAGSGAPVAGAMGKEELDQLVKALNVGSDRDPPGSFEPGDGFAFRVEDLDPLMRISTFEMEQIVLWRMLQKQAANNTVVEWNDKESYGQDGIDGFMSDGTLPELHDTTVSRNFAFVKFLGVQAAITHGSTLVKTPNGSLVAEETSNKMMKLLELMERSLFYGDSSLDSVQWDGYFTQIKNAVASGKAPATQIKDMRGKPLSVEVIERTAGTTHQEPIYGRLTDLFCNGMVKSDLASGLIPYGRSQVGQGAGPDGGIGADFDFVRTTVGKISVHEDAFINFGREASSTGLGDATRRPPTPILSVAPTSPSNSGSLFGSADAGTYTYSVVARNRSGASVPLSVGSVSIAAGDDGRFGIQAAPGNQTLYFEIYRSERNGTLEKLITRVANPNAGFTTVTVIDINADLPGTTMAMAVQFEPRIINFKQLCPIMKILLGQIDLNYRWVQVCYGVPILYVPKKAQLYKNIGLATLAT